MTLVNSYKPLEQAIKDGETIIKIPIPKLLVACAVAEKCEGIPNRISSFLDLLLKNLGGGAGDYSGLYYPILNDKGKTYRIRLSVSLCADALKVMGILKHYGACLHVCKDSDGVMTGEVHILRHDK